MSEIIPYKQILHRIYLFRGKKVMIDRDLAELYGVKTKVLNQAVRRNSSRFPEDFMFQLTKKELEILRSQIVTSNQYNKYIRYLPFVFTEQGVAMLSSVLQSERAIQVNIQIIRAFTWMRKILEENELISKKIEAMEKHYDEQFRVVFKALREMLKEEIDDNNQIGFKST